MRDEEITNLLELYRLSIENAEDVSLACKVWFTDENASLIFPLGMELGWNAIRDNFYGATRQVPRSETADFRQARAFWCVALVRWFCLIGIFMP